MKVIFVCTGNTCRSPMAEYLLKDKLKKRGIKNIQVESAGVAAEAGSPATGYVRNILKRRDIDEIDKHRSRFVMDLDISSDDLILAMTPEHQVRLKNSLPEDYQIFTVHEFIEEKGRVSDPFGGNRESYKNTYKQFCELIDKLVQELVS